MASGFVMVSNMDSFGQGYKRGQLDVMQKAEAMLMSVQNSLAARSLRTLPGVTNALAAHPANNSISDSASFHAGHAQGARDMSAILGSWLRERGDSRIANNLARAVRNGALNVPSSSAHPANAILNVPRSITSLNVPRSSAHPANGPLANAISLGSTSNDSVIDLISNDSVSDGSLHSEIGSDLNINNIPLANRVEMARRERANRQQLNSLAREVAKPYINHGMGIPVNTNVLLQEAAAIAEHYPRLLQTDKQRGAWIEKTTAIIKDNPNYKRKKAIREQSNFNSLIARMTEIAGGNAGENIVFSSRMDDEN